MTKEEWLELADALEHASRVSWASANDSDANKAQYLKWAQNLPLLAIECRRIASTL